MSEKLVVVKHNAAIKAAYRMTLIEQRIMLLCISQIRRNKHDNSRHFILSNDDYCKHFERESSNAYTAMLEAVKRLQQRIITLSGSESPDGWDGACISLLSSHKWHEGEGRIGLSFSQEFMPLLEDLSANFTLFNLRDVSQMKSVYAIRFYELIKMSYEQQKRNSTKPTLLLEVDEIRSMFGLEKKYKAIKDLKRYVIDKAVSEINALSPLSLEYEQIKKGRRIHSIKFHITPKATTLELKNTKSKRVIEKAVKAIKEAFAQNRSVTLLGKKVSDINGGLVSFENETSGNLYMLLVESDAHFVID